MRHLIRVLGTSLCLAALSSDALARDVEPNNTCIPAAARTPLPSSFQGSIDEADADAFTDVDFYFFSAPAGSALRLAVTPTSAAGIFDDSCRLVTASGGPTNLIDFEVPESGNVTIAIGDELDLFIGAGGINPGAYDVQIDPQPPAVGSISGRLVDALTREPITVSRLELQRCTSDFCQAVSSVRLDTAGRFRFERDDVGLRIGGGTFRVEGQPFRYGLTTSAQFDAGAGENVDIGDLAVTPPSIQLSDIRPCAVGAQGGTCRYSVRVRNNTNERFSGVARSTVRGSQRRTSFEASARAGDSVDVRRARLDIPPHGSRTVAFTFQVPAAVQDGTTLCTDLLVTRGVSPLVSGEIPESLFCATKGPDGMRALDAATNRVAFERAHALEATRPAEP